MTSVYEKHRAWLNSHTCTVDNSMYQLLQSNPEVIDTMLNTASAMVSVFDLHHGNFPYFNSRLCALLGLTPDVETKPLLLESFHHSIHPHDLEDVLYGERNAYHTICRLPLMEQKEFSFVTDYRLRTRRGDYVRVLQRIRHLKSDCRNKLWMVLVVISILEEKASEARPNPLLLHLGSLRYYPLRAHCVDKDKGWPLLTPAEMEVLRLAGTGMTTAKIAETLFRSTHTIENQRCSILHKLKLSNIPQAYRYMQQLGAI